MWPFLAILGGLGTLLFLSNKATKPAETPPALPPPPTPVSDQNPLQPLTGGYQDQPFQDYYQAPSQQSASDPYAQDSGGGGGGGGGSPAPATSATPSPAQAASADAAAKAASATPPALRTPAQIKAIADAARARMALITKATTVAPPPPPPPKFVSSGISAPAPMPKLFATKPPAPAPMPKLTGSAPAPMPKLSGSISKLRLP